MEYRLLGWPPDGPALELDHERFAYAGKFVMTRTGKALVEHGADVLAAAAFDPDRIDEDCLRVRYVTVRRDRRGEGIGPRLLRFVVTRAVERGFADLRAGVNNPFAYEAFYRAGFAYTGQRTGLSELVVSTGAERDPETYRDGLATYRERDLSEAERAFLRVREQAKPPAIVEPPDCSGGPGDSNRPGE